MVLECIRSINKLIGIKFVDKKCLLEEEIEIRGKQRKYCLLDFILPYLLYPNKQIIFEIAQLILQLSPIANCKMFNEVEFHSLVRPKLEPFIKL